MNAAPLPVWKRVAVFLIFTAVGPTRGGRGAAFDLALRRRLEICSADLELAGTFLSISFLTSIAYFIAFAQAALTGLVAAFSFSRRQLIRFWPVIAASVFIAAAFL